MKQYLLPPLVVLLLCTTATAYGQDRPQFQFRHTQYVFDGGDPPSLTMICDLHLDRIDVTLTREDGKTFEFSKKNIKAGKEINYSWKQKKRGTFYYNMEVKSVDNVGAAFISTFEFSVTRAAKLEVVVDTENADVKNGRITFTATNPVAEAHLTVYGEGKKFLTETLETYPGKGATGEIEITWEPPTENVIYMELKVTDITTFWYVVGLTPISIHIDPPEHVVFETDSSVIRATEEPKLHEPLKEIVDHLKAYGNELDLKLYVAGYTDTVGSPEHNRELSTARAKSIAKYFRNNGVNIPIYYQGFGEKALKVPTADNVDEEANRRSLFVLSNYGAPKGPGFPGSNWKRLK